VSARGGAAEPTVHSTVEILVVGSPERRAHLQQAMRGLAPLLRGVDRIAEGLVAIRGETAAIILLAGDEHGWADGIAQLRSAGGDREPAIVVVVERGSATTYVRAAYQAGATAVLEWPTEVLLVHDLVLELIALPGDGAARHVVGDVALTEAVASRLRLDKVLGERASCRVIGTTAVVRGELASPWQRDRLVRLVEAVPGITHVIDRGVTIRAATVPDAELDVTVAGVVRSTGNVEARTLETRVSGGVVTIDGHATSAAVLRVRNAVRAIPGVQRVDDRTSDGDG
jgi:osmotically-inducible protein OsmY